MRGSAILLVASLALAGCSFGKGAASAEASIVSFHQSLNAGRFGQIYETSSADMKNATKQEAFVQLLSAVHRKLGAFKSGTTVGWNDNVTPGGEFVTVNYKAVYTAGEAQEQFVYRITDNRGVLAGYNVNSMALVVN